MLGSIAAAEVIAHVGPRPLVELRTLVTRWLTRLDRGALGTAHLWLAERAGSRHRRRARRPDRAAERGDGDELAERFSGRLQFGTAGLRAAVGAGPMRMNRLVVRQAAAGLGQWLLDAEQTGAIPNAAQRGVVIALRRPAQERRVRVRHRPGARRPRHPVDDPSRRATDTGPGVVDHRARRRGRRGGHGVAQPAGRQRLQGVPGRRVTDRRPRRPADLRVHRPRSIRCRSCSPARTIR